MECELFQAIDTVHPDTKESTATLVLGHVKYIHVRNDILNEHGLIDITKFKPVARVGDISYCRLGDVFRIIRPVWETEKDILQDVSQRLY